MYKDLKYQTLAGFEPGIVWPGGGRDDYYATPLRQGKSVRINSRLLVK
jgi:hypothetical protein